MGKLDDVLAAAKAGAADQTPRENALVPASGGSNLPATTGSMSKEAFLNGGGMDVDGYIAINEFGIRLKKDWKGFLDDFEAIIDMDEVVYALGVQKTVGKNVEYAKTYDMQTTSQGGSWPDTVAKFKAESQKPADPYRLAEIPVTLTQGYADPKGGGDVEADTTLGITTSVTAFKPWQKFAKKIEKAGLGDRKIKVKISHSPRTNAAGQNYGVYEFEALEVLED